jgi:hypothetical protein
MPRRPRAHSTGCFAMPGVRPRDPSSGVYNAPVCAYSYPPQSRVDGSGSTGALGQPRAAVLSDLARSEGALRARPRSGPAWAVLQPLSMMLLFHGPLLTIRGCAIEVGALSAVRVRGAAPVDVLFQCDHATPRTAWSATRTS